MHRLCSILSHLTGVCLITAVVFGPMAFGSVEAWAYSILALLSFTALAAALVRHLLCRDKRHNILSPLAWVGFAALLLICLQLVPWPTGLLAFWQPETVLVHQRIAEIMQTESTVYIIPSLYPQATRISRKWSKFRKSEPL